jgi:heme exporter protein D
MSLREFVHMGGYAAFVWPSYALAVIVIQANISAARRSLREAQRLARRRIQSAQGSPS